MALPLVRREVLERAARRRAAPPQGEDPGTAAAAQVSTCWLKRLEEQRQAATPASRCGALRRKAAGAKVVPRPPSPACDGVTVGAWIGRLRAAQGYPEIEAASLRHRSSEAVAAREALHYML